jgi:hypothetical protein
MERTEKVELIGAVLERAADVLGDITRPVVELCYAPNPEIRALFEALYPSDPEHLEGTMVEQSIYCLMYWPERPGEIEIVLVSTIPHHIETVGIGMEHFIHFFDAVGDVVAATIPRSETAQARAWEAQRGELAALMQRSAVGARTGRNTLLSESSEKILSAREG